VLSFVFINVGSTECDCVEHKFPMMWNNVFEKGTILGHLFGRQSAKSLIQATELESHAGLSARSKGIA